MSSIAGAQGGGRGPSAELSPPRVAIACPGVGHVFRGYETFARSLFERLGTLVPCTLFKGLGPDGPAERRLRCLRRTSRPGRAIARLLKPRRAYGAEALTFALALYRHLRRGGEDVVFVPDYPVGRALLFLRQLFPPRRPLAIALHNAAPYPLRKLGRFDLVQQVTPTAQEAAIAAGLDNTAFLTLAADVDRFRPGGAGGAGLKSELGLDVETPLVLCAAAHQRFKRIDLLIEAVALLPAPATGPTPVLLVAGQEGRETARLHALAAHRLGGRALFRRFPPERMAEVYAAAQVFALPSRTEGFGLVLVEAMASGVPVVTQDDATRRWIVGEAGALVDCARPEALSRALEDLLSDDRERARLGALARARAVESFSWPALLPRYVDFFEGARAACRARG